LKPQKGVWPGRGKKGGTIKRPETSSNFATVWKNWNKSFGEEKGKKGGSRSSTLFTTEGGNSVGRVKVKDLAVREEGGEGIPGSGTTPPRGATGGGEISQKRCSSKY